MMLFHTHEVDARAKLGPALAITSHWKKSIDWSTAS